MNQIHGAQAPREMPIACTLTGEDQRQRGDEIAHLFLEGLQEARRLSDGYALRFPGEEVWARRLLAFIVGERACCPFLSFELLFEPDQGPIWLHLRGPDGTPEFVTDLLPRAR